MKLSQEQIEMMQAGICSSPSCGKWADSRNSAGQCDNCHNRQYFERREKEKLEATAKKAEGRAYWQGRGIKTGERVTTVLSSIFVPGGERVYGIAKIGSRGAYVLSHKTKCQARVWDKVK